jgi:hypothetical protein
MPGSHSPPVLLIIVDRLVSEVWLKAVLQRLGMFRDFQIQDEKGLVCLRHIFGALYMELGS